MKWARGLSSDLVEVIVKGVSTLGIKVLTLIVGLIISVILGQELGPEGVGVFSFVEKITLVAYILAIFGTSEYLMKNVAIHLERDNVEYIKHYIVKVFQIVSLFSVSIFLLFILTINTSFQNYFIQDERIYYPLSVLLACLVFRALLTSPITAFLKGIRKTWQANLFQESLPLILRLFLLVLFVYFLSNNLTVAVVAEIFFYSYLFTFVIALGYSVFIQKRIFREKNYLLAKDLKVKEVLRSSFPFLLVSSMTIMASNIDVIMLGVMIEDLSQVGIYSVASKVALLSNFFLIASNSIIFPKIASYLDQYKLPELEKLIRQVNIGLFIIALLVFVFGYLFGEWLLSIWGDGFSEAHRILIILLGGQAVNIATGCVGGVLMMGGKEKDLSRLLMIMTILNIVLNFIFIHVYGSVGAAIATAICIGLENLIKVYLVYKSFNLSVLPFFKSKY
ncbi:oligosaccharide flippase family protein [Sediminitomix flava]|uniref:O-antigen/teichoic acid export membrane protein n=1 Tax=Sediminitomix flava TaxID=379075 RepID=A0A315ZA35_SEDFL|nr:oligosaccharide flippase family protein [Sediminitomix flava]PWJ40940.1 O-antigen/teichoic acid export membrane protein [Sediminitomix flava]